ncbi:MAG: hypothetical protein FJ190_07650 [Gammaproteobacteria bacterium]|nr:hypothetical protein [Gammaproteobacteria bacterium]
MMHPPGKTSELLLLSMWLVGCSQPATYAPVKTVNQAIAPDNGYVPYGLPHLATQSRRQQQSVVHTPALTPQDSIQSQAKAAAQSVQPSFGNSTHQPMTKPPATSTKPSINKNESVKPVSNVQKKLSQKTATPLEAGTNPQNLALNTAKKPQKTVETVIPEREKNNKILLETNSNETTAKKNNNVPIKKLDNTQLTEKNSKISNISIDNKKLLKLNFQWPLQGKITRNFAQTDRKGIEIAGESGKTVVAAETGKAVYCGHGLAGFGNVVIIKHDETFLSAYANNSKLIVKEGQHVAKGQAIGHLGQAGTKKPSLHFEIRKNGNPINPMTVLPNN